MFSERDTEITMDGKEKNQRICTEVDKREGATLKEIKKRQSVFNECVLTILQMEQLVTTDKINGIRSRDWQKEI